MTARQVYEYTLIELNKTEAPSLLIADFVYLVNKAISNYTNKRYNVYDLNQQARDDLRVLEATAVITSLTAKLDDKLQGATYIGVMPTDYLHILNCIAEFRFTSTARCQSTTDSVYYGAKRLTASMYSQIINNYYLRPTYKNPYFYLHSDTQGTITPNLSGQPDEIKTDGQRVGNSQPVTIQLRYGKDNSLVTLYAIHADYLRVPRWVDLTQDEVDADEDLSSTIEFPDYVCLEIIKELVALLMENTSDQRLNTNPAVNQSIAPPAALQQAMAAQQQGGQR